MIPGSSPIIDENGNILSVEVRNGNRSDVIERGGKVKWYAFNKQQRDYVQYEGVVRDFWFTQPPSGPRQREKIVVHGLIVQIGNQLIQILLSSVIV